MRCSAWPPRLSIPSTKAKLPVVTAPWWVGPEYYIAPDADAARLAYDKLLDKHSNKYVFIYTDGSGLDDKIGASEVQLLALPNGNTIEAQRPSQLMGASTQSTVYTGDLCGILMALIIMESVE